MSFVPSLVTWNPPMAITNTLAPPVWHCPFRLCELFYNWSQNQQIGGFRARWALENDSHSLSAWATRTRPRHQSSHWTHCNGSIARELDFSIPVDEKILDINKDERWGRPAFCFEGLAFGCYDRFPVQGLCLLYDLAVILCVAENQEFHRLFWSPRLFNPFALCTYIYQVPCMFPMPIPLIPQPCRIRYSDARSKLHHITVKAQLKMSLLS